MIDVSIEEVRFDENGKMLNFDSIENFKHIIMRSGHFHYGKIRSHSFNRYGVGLLPFQYDPPNTNGCYTQKVWVVHNDGGLFDAEAILISAGLNPVLLRKSLEPEYAANNRAYAIRYKCTYRGTRITEESPNSIDVWGYFANKPLMPPNEDNEYPDEVNMY